MKCFVVLSLCSTIALSLGVPQGSVKLARQEVDADPDSEELGVIPLQPKSNMVAEAPYPPSGWKPAGARLVLPMPRIEFAKKSDTMSGYVYNKPDAMNSGYVYDKPTTEKDESTTVSDDAGTTTEESTTVADDASTTVTMPPEAASSTEAVTMPPTAQRLRKANLVRKESLSLGELNDQGRYYVLLPDPRFERIFSQASPVPQRQRQQRQRLLSRPRLLPVQTLDAPLILYVE